MESTEHLPVRRGTPIPVIIGVAAAATVASLFIRWGRLGESATYSLGPTLPWAYFISATFVGWILGSPRVLPHRSVAGWRSRMLATTYLAIGLAAAVNFALSVALFYPDGAQRSVHDMFMSERMIYSLLGPLIYLVPLAISLPASLLIAGHDARKALTVGAFALIAFTVILGITELSLEFLLLFFRLR